MAIGILAACGTALRARAVGIALVAAAAVRMLSQLREALAPLGEVLTGSY
ncbi:MAG TPA: hypothetical protein VFZ36_01765 [Vicinamibacterales bacterium]